MEAPGPWLTEEFGAEDYPAQPARYNVAPGQDVLVVRAEARGRRRGALVRWGLARDDEGGASAGGVLVNARAETAATRPAFREAFRRRRCLVPAHGFYEWRRGPGGSQPFHVRRKDRRPLGLAAIWERTDGEAGPEERLVILTTAPNAVIAPIHDRMPAIVEPAQYALWLDPDVQDARTLSPLLRPAPGELLTAYTVSPRVNDVACDEPALVEPEEPAQKALF